MSLTSGPWYRCPGALGSPQGHTLPAPLATPLGRHRAWPRRGGSDFRPLRGLPRLHGTGGDRPRGTGAGVVAVTRGLGIPRRASVGPCGGGRRAHAGSDAVKVGRAAEAADAQARFRRGEWLLPLPVRRLFRLLPVRSAVPLPRPALCPRPGRRGGGAVVVRPSVRPRVRRSAPPPPARRAPRDTEAERGQGAARHDPPEPGVRGPR